MGISPHSAADIPGVEDQAGRGASAGNVVGNGFANSPPLAVVRVNEPLSERFELRLSHSASRAFNRLLATSELRTTVSHHNVRNSTMQERGAHADGRQVDGADGLSAGP